MMRPATALTAGAAATHGAGPLPADAPGAEGGGFSAALNAAATGDGPGVAPAPADETPAEEALATGSPLIPGLLPMEDPAAEQPAPGGNAAAGWLSGAAGSARLPGGAQAMPPEDGLLQDEAQMALAGQVARQSRSRDAQIAPNALLLQLAQGAAGSPREDTSGARIALALEPAGAASVVTGAAPTSSSVTSGPASGLEHVVRAAVGSPRWAGELGSRLVMMSVRGQHEGSLTLTPEHLGPLEVRISVNQHTTHVWFGAQQADTRAALAEALPRLRELFAEAGLSLGQADVSHEAPRQDAREAADAQSAAQGEAGAARQESVAVAVRRITSGLLDLYA